LAAIDCISLRIVSLAKAGSPNFFVRGSHTASYYTTVRGPDIIRNVIVS